MPRCIWGIVWRLWRRLALLWPSLWQTGLVVLLFLPLAIFVSEITNWLIPYVPTLGLNLEKQLGAMDIEKVIIAACFFPAVGEELLFRGFIGRGLVGRYGRVAGVLITSAIFGAIHLEPLQAIGAFFIGIVLHYVYLTTKSLFVPIMLHFLNNFLAVVAMRYAETVPIPGISAAGEGGEVIHTPVGILLTSVALLGILCVLFYQTRSSWRTPDGHPWRIAYPTAEMPADSKLSIQSEGPRAMPLTCAIVFFCLLGCLLHLAIHSS